MSTIREEEKELLEGINYSDEALKKMSASRKELEPLVYGDLTRELDEDESEVTKLNPKMAVFGKIELKEIRREYEVSKTKVRYNKNFNGAEEEEEIVTERK